MGMLVHALIFFPQLLAWLGLSQFWVRDPKSYVRVHLEITDKNGNNNNIYKYYKVPNTSSHPQ